MRVLRRTLFGGLFLLSFAWGQSRILPEQMAPFVPTPHEVVARMLALADIQPNEIVVDLGCGDGRVPIHAAKKYKANAVGVELAPRLVKISRNNVKVEDLEDRVRIVEGHLMDVNLRDADVVTLYLLTDANETVKPKLEAELKKGARVVSHDFEVMNWVPVKVDEVKVGHRVHKLYLYKMPPRKLDSAQ